MSHQDDCTGNIIALILAAIMIIFCGGVILAGYLIDKYAP